jgi:hypothetical protein
MITESDIIKREDVFKAKYELMKKLDGRIPKTMTIKLGLIEYAKVVEHFEKYNVALVSRPRGKIIWLYGMRVIPVPLISFSEIGYE